MPLGQAAPWRSSGGHRLPADFKTVWIISADGTLEPGTAIDPMTLDRVRLFRESDGAPIVWTGNRWLKWAPWAGAFNLLDKAPVVGPELDAIDSGDPGLALWVTKRADDDYAVAGFRFLAHTADAVRNTLLSAGPLQLAPIGSSTSTARRARFASTSAASARSGRKPAFVTSVTFADFALDLDVTASAPVIVVRDERGAELRIGGASCGFGRSATHLSLHVTRNGARVDVTPTAAPRTCPAPLAEGCTRVPRRPWRSGVTASAAPAISASPADVRNAQNRRDPGRRWSTRGGSSSIRRDQFFHRRFSAWVLNRRWHPECTFAFQVNQNGRRHHAEESSSGTRHQEEARARRRLRSPVLRRPVRRSHALGASQSSRGPRPLRGARVPRSWPCRARRRALARDAPSRQSFVDASELLPTPHRPSHVAPSERSERRSRVERVERNDRNDRSERASIAPGPMPAPPTPRGSRFLLRRLQRRADFASSAPDAEEVTNYRPLSAPPSQLASQHRRRPAARPAPGPRVDLRAHDRELRDRGRSLREARLPPLRRKSRAARSTTLRRYLFDDVPAGSPEAPR